MTSRSTLIRGLALLSFATFAATLAAPADALSLRLADLNNLVAGNSSIVIAQVQGASSHYNQPGTFILTDLRLRVDQVLKGRLDPQVVITQMGGSAGRFTTLIPGGAVLVPGRSYVLFLRQESLPGTGPVTTVAEHCQGIFDIETRNGVLWAVSQAAEEPLVSEGGDGKDEATVPGGLEGMSLDQLVRSIQALVGSTDGGGK